MPNAAETINGFIWNFSIGFMDQLHVPDMEILISNWLGTRVQKFSYFNGAI